MLASIYSPDLLVTVQNLLQASKAGNRRPACSDARTRLELLGIDKPQIDEIVHDRQGQHAPEDPLADQRPRDPEVRPRRAVRRGGSRCTTWPICRPSGFRPRSMKTTSPFLPVAQDASARHASRANWPSSPRRGPFPNEEFHGTLNVRLSARRSGHAHGHRAVRDRQPDHKLRPGSTATVRLFIPPQQIESLAVGRHVGRSSSEELAQGRVLAVPEACGHRHGRPEDRLSASRRRACSKACA